jgi:multisubunit Na+/H+ antiporter MnhE subunit
VDEEHSVTYELKSDAQVTWLATFQKVTPAVMILRFEEKLQTDSSYSVK